MIFSIKSLLITSHNTLECGYHGIYIDMGRVCMGRVGMVLDLVAEFVMGRVCQGPSLSWAEFVMGRDVPESPFL